jgi:hypothetical protein
MEISLLLILINLKKFKNQLILKESKKVMKKIREEDQERKVVHL